MPKGPNGEQRSTNVTQCAVQVGRIATGEIENDSASEDGSLLSEVLREEEERKTTNA